MKLTMYKCDRCGCLVDEGNQFVLLAPTTESRDLCAACAQRIFHDPKVEEELRTGCDEVAKPKEGTVKITKRGVKQKVDHGKIRALFNAGWKICDIAMDVKCSEQTVYNVLKRAQESDDAVGRSDD